MSFSPSHNTAHNPTSSGEHPIVPSMAAYPGSRTNASPPLHILVVDDAPDIAFLFSVILRQAGYGVVTEHSAYAALQAANETHFDVVLSDIGMPGMNGYELARSLREIPGYETVPLIAVTGFAEFSDRSDALNAGFNAHVNKPVEPPHLLELIAGLCC